mmetsp:Transcript_36308/g.76268  ORF Transcript_36308/g.76268 Transcript_36308/m.76268 type:complete len:85 (+) Transcript_36308:1745-1999(+)
MLSKVLVCLQYDECFHLGKTMHQNNQFRSATTFEENWAEGSALSHCYEKHRSTPIYSRHMKAIYAIIKNFIPLLLVFDHARLMR